MRFISSIAISRETTDRLIDFKRDVLTMSDQEIDDFYNALPHSQEYTTDVTDECLAYILKLIGRLPDNYSILDIACGSGYCASLIAKQKRHVTGIDLVKPKEEYRSEWFEYIKGDITNIPCEDKSFDLTLSAHTLEHVVDIQKAISELRRVTKKLLIAVIPCQKEYKYMFDSHVHFFLFCESFQRVMGNYSAKCFMCGGDILYIENLI